MATQSYCRYYVRGGEKSGLYLTRRRYTKGTTRKYSWTNKRPEAVYMSYDQARNAIRNTYGGELVKRVYKNKKLVAEFVVR